MLLRPISCIFPLTIEIPMRYYAPLSSRCDSSDPNSLLSAFSFRILYYTTGDGSGVVIDVGLILEDLTFYYPKCLLFFSFFLVLRRPWEFLMGIALLLIILTMPGAWGLVVSCHSIYHL